MFRIRGRTHPGAVREHNEDAFYCDDDTGFAVVADGMGGYAAGEVASEIIVSSLKELKPAADGMVAALVECHNRIVAHARANPDSKGMGSAVVAARLAHQKVSVCWAGDSRAYLFSKGQLKAVSRDHSYVQWLLSQGQITAEQARSHPERNLVTQCLGLQPPQPELTTVPWQRGDLLLLCSDGLTDELTDSGIAAVLAEAKDSASALEHLVEAALANGGKDNITVILAENLAPVQASAEPRVVTKNRGAATSLWLPIALGVGLAAALGAAALWFFMF